MDDRTMKVALLVASDTPGGAEKSAAELAVAMKGLGVPPMVLLPRSNPLVGFLADGNVRVLPVDLSSPVRPSFSRDFAQFAASLTAIGGLRRALSNFDIVIASADAAMTYVLFSGFRGRVIYVVRDTRAGGPLRRAFFRRADVIAGISGFVRKVLREELAPEEKTELVMNGIDPAFYRNVPEKRRARRELGVPSDRPVVLWLGNLTRWKRPETFVRTAAGFSGEAVFLLAGRAHFRSDRSYAGRVLASAERECVKVVPFRPDPRVLYAAASLVMVTSENEPFGRVAVEGMAAGVPVAALRSGALPEIVEDGRTGVLASTTEELKRRVWDLIEHPGALEDMSAACRRRAGDFDVRKTAGGMIALLG